MLRLILVQTAATLLAAMVAGAIAGLPAFLSLLLGGMCCVLPNGLFALRLFAGVKQGTANPMTFFFGEMIKIALTIALLGAVGWTFHGIQWPAFIAGMIVALKSYVILLFRH